MDQLCPQLPAQPRRRDGCGHRQPPGRGGRCLEPQHDAPALPAQGPQIERPYTAIAATATSGTAANAIDGLNDNNFNTLWTTTGAFPQSITLDLGQSRPDVGIVSVTPRYMNNRPVADGNITSYRVLTE